MSSEEYLINRIKQLEVENILLKNQVKELKRNTFGWDNLLHLINDKLKILNLKENRPYGNFEGKLTDSISQIIRITFNLKFIKNLDSEHYDKAKEITETVLNFAIDNFVKDEFWASKFRKEND
ncbi:hypothetical protein KQI77_02255 [Clostridium sp. MSJ-8]|uniref:hypothetical protein n=1 Tax=Clostridium sp. MSJ-8 TaxID=2841510 RepID=UPI001C0EEAF1|nr:hypothetical protein [Clostridium sp. MSJ-8]MBU5486986.1 hypothetical protein [Clostridium sp. MSJ-8]